MNAEQLKRKHDAGLDYQAYLATDEEKATDWQRVYDRIDLDDAQRRLVSGFTREINVLAISGIWCGDCVQQLPIAQRIAETNPDRIDLRYVDRDEHMDLSERVKINAGLRVPLVIFMAEDHEPVSIFGDRSLTRYRALATKQLGGACPLPGARVRGDELRGTLKDWLDEFERVHLLLRLSGRLRQRHGD